MSTKFVSLGLEDEQLALLNWLMTEPSEYRQWGEKELLCFISPSELDELRDLLEAIDSDYFTDGGMKDITYNGQDLVFDTYSMLKWTADVDPKWFYKEWESQSD